MAFCPCTGSRMDIRTGQVNAETRRLACLANDDKGGILSAAGCQITQTRKGLSCLVRKSMTLKTPNGPTLISQGPNRPVNCRPTSGRPSTRPEVGSSLRPRSRLGPTHPRSDRGGTAIDGLDVMIAKKTRQRISSFGLERVGHRVILGPRGAIAQLGERLHGMQEVRGSIPLGSTNLQMSPMRENLSDLNAFVN